jgi:hypothetical protein
MRLKRHNRARYSPPSLSRPLAERREARQRVDSGCESSPRRSPRNKKPPVADRGLRAWLPASRWGASRDRKRSSAGASPCRRCRAAVPAHRAETGESTSCVGTGRNLGGIGTRIVIGAGPGVGFSQNLSPMPNGRNQHERHWVHSGPQVIGRTKRSQTPAPFAKAARAADRVVGQLALVGGGGDARHRAAGALAAVAVGTPRQGAAAGCR